MTMVALIDSSIRTCESELYTGFISRGCVDCNNDFDANNDEQIDNDNDHDDGYDEEEAEKEDNGNKKWNYFFFFIYNGGMRSLILSKWL